MKTFRTKSQSTIHTDQPLTLIETSGEYAVIISGIQFPITKETYVELQEKELISFEIKDKPPGAINIKGKKK